MSDPEDGAGRAGPSDDPADEDPFEYPSDERTDAGGDGPDATRSDAVRAGQDGGGDADDESQEAGGWLRRVWTADSGAAIYVRDVLTSVGAVLLVGVLLFAVSGIWPPMVAVESGSMEPNMNVGDLVFVVDNERFVPDHAAENGNETTGIVPADEAARVGHTQFGENGDVVVFMPNGNDRQTPVIHRAMLFVEDGENWYDRADESAVGSADDCEELDYCPSPHAGFITKGDNQQSNGNYDQVSGLTEPVRPDWIIGTAEVKVPYLGHVRLLFSGQVALPPDTVTATQADATVTQADATATQADATVTATSAIGDSRTAAVPAAGPPRPVA